MPDVISGVIIAHATCVTIIWRWQRYEKNRNDQIKLEKNYAKTRKSVKNGQKYRRKSHFASKNGDFNTRFAFFSYLCGQQKQNGMDKEELRKEFEAIRQDRQQYDRDRILDSWEATVLFRNRELEHRVDKLEEKIFSQNVTNNVLILTVGFFIGVLLCHIFG